MLELKDFMPVNYLKKEKFTGSYQGMRFRMEQAEEDGQPRLAVTVWPEPYSHDATPETERERVLFDFDGDGIGKGVEWLNRKYEEERERWRKAAGR